MGSQNSRLRIKEGATHAYPPAPIVFRQNQVNLSLHAPCKRFLATSLYGLQRKRQDTIVMHNNFNGELLEECSAFAPEIILVPGPAVLKAAIARKL